MEDQLLSLFKILGKKNATKFSKSLIRNNLEHLHRTRWKKQTVIYRNLLPLLLKRKKIFPFSKLLGSYMNAIFYCYFNIKNVPFDGKSVESMQTTENKKMSVLKSKTTPLTNHANR